MSTLRDLVAEVYDGVPVVMGEGDGEWLLTHDEQRAYAALDRFHREHCDMTTHAFWRGHVPAARPAWLKPTPDDPDCVWRICEPDDPHAVPALYIGEGGMGW